MSLTDRDLEILKNLIRSEINSALVPVKEDIGGLKKDISLLTLKVNRVTEIAEENRRRLALLPTSEAFHSRMDDFIIRSEKDEIERLALANKVDGNEKRIEVVEQVVKVEPI